MDQRAYRGQTTREKIVDTSLRLFADEGYAEVSIETILRQCGISRGALYHHYASKEAIFVAVLEAAELRVVEAAHCAAGQAKNPLDALRAGCAAWLDMASNDAVVRRIVLTDAPAVVGWERWREIDTHYGLGMLKAGFAALAEAGRLPANRVELSAHALLAVLTEIALLLARSTKKDDILAGQEIVEQVLSRFAGVEPYGCWEV